MLTKVEVRTAGGRLLALPLQDLSTGYLVVDIDGIDPVKASLVSSKFGQLDGTRFQASSRENRNLIIKLKLQPAYAGRSAEFLRSNLYEFFMPKSKVNLKFFKDGVGFVELNAIVEDMSAPRFSREPEATIMLTGFDPDFYALDSVRISGSSVSNLTESTVSYPGSIETGFLFTLSLNRAISEFQIHNKNANGEQLVLDFYSPLLAGDILTISTLGGSKFVRVLRAGTERSFMYAVAPFSNWVALYPGENKIRVQCSGAAIPYTIDYKAKYGGI